MNYRNFYAIKLAPQDKTSSGVSFPSSKSLLVSLLSCFFASIIFAGWVGFKLVMSDELFSISSPLSGITRLINSYSHDEFMSALSAEEEAQLADKIHFVSNVIGRANRKSNNSDIAKTIVATSVRAQMDPLLVAAIIKSESSFKPGAISNKGARGLMQLMPDTARFTEQNLVNYADKYFGVNKNLHKPEYNIALGITYLKHLEEEFSGNRELALIAYNWGPGNLKSALKNKTKIPEETRQYARKILLNHRKWNQEFKLASNFFSGPSRG